MFFSGLGNSMIVYLPFDLGGRWNGVGLKLLSIKEIAAAHVARRGTCLVIFVICTVFFHFASLGND